MRKNRLTMTAGIMALSMLACAGCARTEKANSETIAETTTATALERETSAGTQPAEVNAENETQWKTEGTFIDENGNHLLLYHVTKANGYDKDCWTVTALFGEEFYGGEMKEKGRELFGEIVSYDNQGNPTKSMHVSLFEDGDAVMMNSDEGKEYRFIIDETDYSAAQGEVMPIFSYNDLYAFHDFDSLHAAAYDYLSHDKEWDYDLSHALIPYVNIVELDATNPKDALRL